MRKLVGGMFAISLLVSCMTTYYIDPKVGIPTTVYVGDHLLREGTTSAFSSLRWESNPYDIKQTLIYTGAEGTVLRFTYREFKNNTARPAFTIDAIYDIENDKVIRFKGASLEVISVDNQSITYKLVSGFRS